MIAIFLILVVVFFCVVFVELISVLLAFAFIVLILMADAVVGICRLGRSIVRAIKNP